MAILTIRRLDPSVKKRLRVRAARRGHSMEEEARRILATALSTEERLENLADIALGLFGPEHGVELDVPARCSARQAPRFE